MININFVLGTIYIYLLNLAKQYFTTIGHLFSKTNMSHDSQLKIGSVVK